MQDSPLFTHRSIRKFSSTPIASCVVERIVEAGVRASNTGNMQTYCVVSTEDAARKAAMAPLHFNQPMVTQAPLLMTVCVDFHRFEWWCRSRKAEPGYRNLLGILTATVDASLFAQNLCLAAESEGLGICYLGTTLYSMQGMVDLLSLPKGVIPLCTIAVGYAGEQPDLTPRLPLDAVWHREAYAVQGSGDLDRLHGEFERLPQHQRFVEENGLESLAQVFTNVRYKPSVYESISVSIAETLRRQGFSI